MSGDVAVSLFITTHQVAHEFLPSVLLDVSEIVTADNDGALHLGRDDKTLQDGATNRNVGSEGTLLINVLSANGSLRGLNTETNISIPTLVGLLTEEVDLTVNHLLTSQERVAMNFDRQSRTASAQFMQYGTAFCYVNFSGKFGRVWLEPGATTDVYLDMSHTGLRLMAKREGKAEPTCYDNGLYATGKYGDISRARSALTMAYMMRVKYDYQEPTEKWIERNLADYLHRVDSLDKMPDRHPLHKKISRLELDESFIGAIISYDLEVRSDMIIKNHRDSVA